MLLYFTYASDGRDMSRRSVIVFSCTKSCRRVLSLQDRAGQHGCIAVKMTENYQSEGCYDRMNYMCEKQGEFLQMLYYSSTVFFHRTIEHILA